MRPRRRPDTIDDRLHLTWQLLIRTEGTVSAGFIGSDFEKALVAQVPLGRTGRVGDIAPLAVFLASDDSAWLTGEQLVASGGLR